MDRQTRAKDLVSGIVVAAHWAAATAVLSIPLYAVVAAATAAFDPADRASFPLAAGRWGVLLANTVVVTFVAIVVALVLGTIAGALAGRTNVPVRIPTFLALSYAACLPPFVIASMAFAILPPWATPASPWLCGAYCGLTYAPLAAIVMAARLRTVEADLEDAARLDATPARVFCRVTLRLAAGGAAAIALVIGWLVATDFTIPDLLQVPTFAREVYTQYSLHRSAAAPLATGAPAWVALLVILAMALRGSATERPDPGPTTPSTFVLGTAGKCAGLIFLLAWLGGLLVPLGGLVARVGSLRAFGASVYAAGTELTTSMWLVGCAAIVMLLLAVGCASALVRGGVGRRIGPFVLATLLALPAPVAGIALTGILNRPGWAAAVFDSPAILVIGYVVRLLPVAVVLMAPAVARVPAELEATAKVDGANWLAIQRYLIWPLVWLDALAVGAVISILAFGEVGCTVLLRPPAWEVASTWIFTELHKGLNRDVAAVSLASCGFLLVAWAGLVLVVRRVSLDTRCSVGPVWPFAPRSWL